MLKIFRKLLWHEIDAAIISEAENDDEGDALNDDIDDDDDDDVDDDEPEVSR